jgi:hypothetical protein
MKRWQGSCIGVFFALLICGGLLIFLVPFGGSMISANSALFDPLTARVLCPEAVGYSYDDYGAGQPTTTSPSGGTGHYTELTCTYQDGTEKTFGNEEVGLKGLAASFSAAALCGAAGVLIFMVLAGIAGAWLVKPKPVQG